MCGRVKGLGLLDQLLENVPQSADRCNQVLVIGCDPTHGMVTRGFGSPVGEGSTADSTSLTKIRAR